MKRDMELVRKLLLHIEENCGSRHLQSPEIGVDGYEPDEIAYNVRCMVDGELLDVIDATAMQDRFGHYIIKGITWKGHDFLDSVRNDGVWSRTKERLKPLGSVSFDVLRAVAIECAKGMILPGQ